MRQDFIKLSFENKEGKRLRTVVFNSEKAHIILRKDSGRIELVEDLGPLKQKKMEFIELGEVQKKDISNLDLDLGNLGRLRNFDFSDESSQALRDAEMRSDKEDRLWWMALFATILLVMSFVIFISLRPVQTEKLEAELREEVVKIVKNIPVTPQKARIVPNSSSNQQQAVTKSGPSLKRMGALGVLGSLNASKQRGGLNLGAAQTSAGPGLGGGTQGSGGVQTGIYAKGIIAAPVGAGGNLQGAGGYGTKGKGGGQAGYGTTSLVGAQGASPVPLGSEAVIEGGLDRDAIAAVIQRNLGQVRFCYEQGLQGTPSLQGRVAVDFTISAQGTVNAAQIASSSLNSKIVEDCIAMRLKSWKFPLPQGGVSVKVSYPFVLQRAGQGAM